MKGGQVKAGFMEKDSPVLKEAICTRYSANDVIS